MGGGGVCMFVINIGLDLSEVGCESQRGGGGCQPIIKKKVMQT